VLFDVFINFGKANDIKKYFSKGFSDKKEKPFFILKFSKMKSIKLTQNKQPMNMCCCMQIRLRKAFFMRC